MGRGILPVTLCALAVSAVAQQAPPDPAVVMEQVDKQLAPFAAAWLKSADPRVAAWGAYLVLRERNTDAIPDLLSLLAGFQSPSDADRHDAMLGVLDALIELEARVPVAEAQRIYPEFPVQSMILLARSQEDAAPALLDIFEHEQRWRAAWLAAGNLLCERRSSGFAAAVLTGMTVHAQIIVTEPGNGGGVGGGTLCCGMAAAPQAGKAGWPLLGVYSFSGCGKEARPGATLLAAGVESAYYQRRVTAAYRDDGAAGCCHMDEDLVREHYVTALLSMPADQPVVRAHVSHSITWAGADAYRGGMAAFITDQQRVFQDVARRLNRAGLLSDDENNLRPALQILVLDWRSSREIPLPAIDGLPENVTLQ